MEKEKYQEMSPEEVKKFEEENMTEDQYKDNGRRAKVLKEFEKVDGGQETAFETAEAAIESSRRTHFIRWCADTPENRAYLEKMCDEFIQGPPDQYLYEVTPDEDGDLSDDRWHVDIKQ